MKRLVSSQTKALTSCLPSAIAAVRDHLGWRHAMVVMGALQASIIACGTLLRPIIVIAPSSPPAAKTTGDSLSSQDSGVQSLPEDKMEDTALKGASEEEEVKREEETSPLEAARPKTKTKLLDFSILHEGSFICYSLFGLFATLGFFAPTLYIIELSVSRHVERDRATYMLSVMAVAEVLGRLAVGGAMTRPRLLGHKLRVLLGCVVAMVLVLLGFTLVWEFYGLAVCCAGYGFFMGAIACTHIPLLAEDQVVGIQRMASAAGVYVFIQSFAGLAGPPLGGKEAQDILIWSDLMYTCLLYGCVTSCVLIGSRALRRPSISRPASVYFGKLLRCFGAK